MFPENATCKKLPHRHRRQNKAITTLIKNKYILTHNLKKNKDQKAPLRNLETSEFTVQMERLTSITT